MSRKRYFSLVRCLCVILCCITFLATSLTTEAATGDIIYSGSGSDWTCTTDDAVWYSSGVLNYNHVNVVFYYGIPASYVDSYSGNYIDVTCSNLYVPIEFNSDRTQISYDSESGIFMNGKRVSEFTFMGSLFNSYYTFITNGVTNTDTHYYTFQYLNDVSFTISKSDLVYVPSSDIYTLRLSARYYVASPNFAYYKLRKTNANQFNVHSLGYSYWLDLNSFPNYTLVLKESSSIPSSSVPTNDSSTQNAINNQTSKVEEGNQIAEQGNTIAQENSDTNKDTNNKITSFFNSFFDNLIGVFVPESGFFSQWFSDLNDFMAQKLGFLWSPFDFLIQFLNGVYSGGGSASIVFPELAWIDGTVIIPRTEFSFDNICGESFQDLRDMIYFATDVILLGAVVAQFYKKVKLVFEGGGD